MLDTSIDDEAVACVGLEDIASDIDADRAADDVDELMVRMAMTCPNPVLIEEVPHQHELICIRQNLSTHSGLGSKCLRILIFDEGHTVSIDLIQISRCWTY